VLRPAAARQSGPQPGSGRSPPQHGHGRRSMTTVAEAAEGLPRDGNRVGKSWAGDGQRAPRMSDFCLQCPTWTSRPAGMTSLSESPGMTVIPSLTRRLSRSQPARQHRA
jgi:hypothetical protein